MDDQHEDWYGRAGIGDGMRDAGFQTAGLNRLALIDVVI
jgi:hypothetical protein